MSYLKRLLKCPYPKKPSLHGKIHGYLAEKLVWETEQFSTCSFCKLLKGKVFSNTEIYLKLEVAFLIHYPTGFSEIATVVSFF